MYFLAVVECLMHVQIRLKLAVMMKRRNDGVYLWVCHHCKSLWFESI